MAGAQRFARERAGGGDVRGQGIPGTGHFVYDDEPETAAQALAAFLAAGAAGCAGWGPRGQRAAHGGGAGVRAEEGGGAGDSSVGWLR